MAALAASSRYRLLQITFTTSHDPPRDTLNDEGTLLFFCLSHRSTKRLFLFYFVLNNGLRSGLFHRIAEAQRAARVRLMLGPSHWSEKTAPARIPRRGER